MNIWAWVRSTKKQLNEAGNNRLADLMDRLPTAVCDNEHERVDSIYPEALALAKKSGNPWIEVFVRHWNLQSRILHRHEVADWTGEAVSLIEFANRPETQECPQSVCVTQDLVNGYGNVDGPGFVTERLEATAETLARINAQWPCWVCISSERSDALIDGDRAEEALAFIDQQTQAMVEAGMPRARTALLEEKAMALMALDRCEQALECLDNLEPPRDRNDEVERGIDRARVLIRLERHDEALEQFPPFKDVEDTPGLYPDWCEAVADLVRANKIVNDWQLDARFERMTARLIRQGVRRNAINLLFARADLALRRKRPHIAQECVDRGQALFDGLHRRLDERGDAVALIGRINVADPVPVELPDEEDAVYAALQQDPELDLPLLEAAAERWPESHRVVRQRARMLNARCRFDVAQALLEEFLATHDAPELAAALGQTLLDAGDHEGLREMCSATLARDPSPALKSQCHWLLARSYKDTDAVLCRENLEEVVAIEPDANNCQMWLARLEREAGDLHVALERLNGVIEREENAGAWDWDRMIVGTLLQDWDAVRDSARRVGYQIPDDHEGELRFPGVLCRIRFEREDGTEQILFARRNGPVSADIVQMRPEPPCRFMDTVVFDATPLNNGPTLGEEERHTWLYPAVKVVDPGGFTIHPLDGVHPGTDPLAKLRERLEELGCQTQVFSGDSYRLEHPKTKKDLLGLYMMLAVPDTLDPVEVDRLLGEITANWAHPFTWMTLAEKAGNELRVHAHGQIVEDFGM